MQSSADKRLEAFLDSVNAQLRRRCGISWVDASRDLALQRALAAGESAEEFVTRFIRTVGLATMSTAWGHQP